MFQIFSATQPYYTLRFFSESFAGLKNWLLQEKKRKNQTTKKLCFFVVRFFLPRLEDPTFSLASQINCRSVCKKRSFLVRKSTYLIVGNRLLRWKNLKNFSSEAAKLRTKPGCFAIESLSP